MKERDYSELLAEARNCWMRRAGFRRDRERNKRFTYGDQWSDTLTANGYSASEEEMLISQGHLPLKNNLIRRLVRNVLGVYRNRGIYPRPVARDPSEADHAATIGRLLRYNMDLNRMEEVYARTMEEFLISGLAVHKKWYGRRGGRSDCWTEAVQPERFFIDTDTRDTRGWDITLAGEIHEYDYPTLIASFARSEAEAERLRRIYGIPAGAGYGDVRCEVTEVWRREQRMAIYCHDTLRGRRYTLRDTGRMARVRAENERREREYGEEARLIHTRLIPAEEWHYYFLAPSGEALRTGISPYAHGRHPYVIKAYPFIDGEIHSFVSDIIDQQKVANRLITMYDWILRASAKGVLLFPEGALPEGTDMADIAEEWSRFNGVIVYRPKPGVPLPQQVSSNSTDIGITQLLDIQMKMMEDISGVNGALQGKLDSNSMSGTLYNQQTQNSLTALADLILSFEDFMAQAAETDISNICQYYTPRRIEAITGSHAGLAASLSPTPTFFHTPFDIALVRGRGKE